MLAQGFSPTLQTTTLQSIMVESCGKPEIMRL